MTECLTQDTTFLDCCLDMTIKGVLPGETLPTNLWGIIPANGQRWGNVVTTLSVVRSDTTLLPRRHNVEDECYITTLWQRCHIIGITLWQPRHNVGKLCYFTMLPQHCYRTENDVKLQRSHSIQASHLNASPQRWEQRCHDIHTTLPECWQMLVQRSHNVV